MARVQNRTPMVQHACACRLAAPPSSGAAPRFAHDARPSEGPRLRRSHLPTLNLTRIIPCLHLLHEAFIARSRSL
jgi:hypothetical protein